MSPQRIARKVRKTAQDAPEWIRRFRATLCTTGLLTGTVFFIASLTPSLLPRGWVMQGLLSGFSFSAGYAIGVTARWIWSYLELPVPTRQAQRIWLWTASGVCLAVAVAFLWQASAWQSDIRVFMGLEPVDTARPFRVGGIAVLVFVLLLAIARLFDLTFRLIASRLSRRTPRRVANIGGLVLAVMVFWSVIDGVLFRYALRAADASFQQVDARMEPDLAPPSDPIRTGSSASFVAWEDLGRTGRNFVAGTARGQELQSFFGGGEVTEPVRVYVGLNAAETIEERAALALAELQRVGAFDRSVLVIVTPTGTGWVDPSAMGPVEYLLRGDVASVAVQYSYLPSWLSLMVEPQYGAETADAVFRTIYDHWRTLPAEERPDLYLHGLSLGALNSEQSADLYDVIGDPYAGALWAGPPFRSSRWRTVTAQREPESPAWLPRFRDESVVRFMNQHGMATEGNTRWGPIRILYLQYASDPITFFEPELLYRQPEWLEEPRGPDVTDRLRWFPVVTMLQLVADLAVADTAPPGFGHVFAAEDYIDAWVALMEPAGWDEAEVARLKEVHRAD